MNSTQAIEILSKRADHVAQALGVSEGAGWRDYTGTAHLYIRGALQSLERISNEEHSPESVTLAIGTVGYAGKSSDGFLGEHTEQAAQIAMKILQTEMAGGNLADAVSSADIDLILNDLNGFTNDVAEQSRSPDADRSLKAFSGALESANQHFQDVSADWKMKIFPIASEPSIDFPFEPS